MDSTIDNLVILALGEKARHGTAHVSDVLDAIRKLVPDHADTILARRGLVLGGGRTTERLSSDEPFSDLVREMDARGWGLAVEAARGRR